MRSQQWIKWHLSSSAPGTQYGPAWAREHSTSSQAQPLAPHWIALLLGWLQSNIFSLPSATLLPQLQMSVCVQLREKHLSEFQENKCQPATELVRKFWWGWKLFKSWHHVLFSSNPVCVKQVDLRSYKLCARAGELVMIPIILKQPPDCKKCEMWRAIVCTRIAAHNLDCKKNITHLCLSCQVRV